MTFVIASSQGHHWVKRHHWASTGYPAYIRDPSFYWRQLLLEDLW